jgi:hypothetical protein
VWWQDDSPSSPCRYDYFCERHGPLCITLLPLDAFENMGWKVYRVAETATVLLGGGVVFSTLSAKQACDFQGNLLKTMLQLEETYMELAREDAKMGRNAIVICDRGAMDPSAYMPRSEWLSLLASLGLTVSFNPI